MQLQEAQFPRPAGRDRQAVTLDNTPVLAAPRRQRAALTPRSAERALYPGYPGHPGKAQTGQFACGIVDGMTQKVPSPKDIKAAAQAAAETAQSVASGAMRIPPASIQLASQLPDLVENLATATVRLNEAIDRAERYLALADPMIRTMDAILPQLEALVATGNEVYSAVASVPGISTLSRLATRGADAAPRKRLKRPAAPNGT